jgi:hypothetical protein
VPQDEQAKETMKPIQLPKVSLILGDNLNAPGYSRPLYHLVKGRLVLVATVLTHAGGVALMKALKLQR